MDKFHESMAKVDRIDRSVKRVLEGEYNTTHGVNTSQRFLRERKEERKLALEEAFLQHSQYGYEKAGLE